MKIEQAIVSSVSARTGIHHRLISKSANVNNEIVDALYRWSPCRDELEFGQTESVNFFPIDEDTMAISRSFIGGYDKSRGGTRLIFSHAAIFHQSQLAGYQNNVISLYRVLRSMGLLILQTWVPDELPVLDIPTSPFCQAEGFAPELESSITDQLVRAIDIHHQVILVGHQAPVDFLECFLAEIPLSQRLEISFATGLNVADQRPFTLQFFQEPDDVLEREFASRQLRTISLVHSPALGVLA